MSRYLVTAVLGLAAAAMPLPAGADTLRDALLAAWQNSPTLEAERDSAAIAGERINQARANRRPTVDLFGSYVYESIDSDRPFAFNLGDRPVASTQLEARLPVYTGGRLDAGVRQARAGAMAANAQLDSTGQRLLLDTVTAYVDIIRDREVISIRENSIDLLRGQLTESQDRFDVGDVTRTDVALSEARLEGGRAQLAAAQARLEGSLANYAQLTGLEAGLMTPVPSAPDLPDTFDEALAIALESNPDLQAAQHAERAAREAVDVAKGALRPEVSIIGQAGLQEYHTEGWTDTSMSAGAQARIPLYSGGAKTSMLQESKLALSRARTQIAQFQRIIRTQTAQAWYGHEAAEQSVAASRRQVDAAEIAYEGAREELSVGVRTTLDVLQQEQQLLEARLALATAERDRYVAAHQLLAAMGQLTPARLGLSVRE
ncbi:TolC family outer membrane protein [Henriciella aquimarina]|uniref:TolC family outer membrane protein n=1 Tax=Henriciella aquimarina TaxID=545261 RepID=UPI0009FD11B9|nr:TolC family outer membrane protein [Henriciella aquimarina]